MIREPGVYDAVPMAEYLEIQAASASLLHTLLDECPAAAWFCSHLNPKRVRETSDAADAGTIAHAILLEGSSDCVEVIDPEDYPGKNGSTPAGWTNQAIRAARDGARAAGRIPVLVDDIATINNMVDSAQAFIESLRDSEPAIWQAFQPAAGDSELTMLWQDGPTLCRMRPDRISRDRKVIVDPKFTKRSAEPESFSRTQISAMGYRISASMYRRGCQQIFGTTPDYVFLVVQQDPPHLCSLVGVEPIGLAMADEQVEVALRTWARCVASNAWPAYPRRVCYAEPAAWEIARWQERQGLDEAHAIPFDLAKLFERKVA